MKHRINLYSNEYVPSISLISLNSVVFVCVTLIAIFVLINGVLAWQSHHIQTTLHTKRSELNQLQSVVNDLQHTLVSRKPDPVLLQKIEQQKRELIQREDLLNEIAKREPIKSSRFSEVLADLRSADLSTIWLTTIEVDTDAVTLEGFGSEADAMPIWLSHLSATTSFSGVDFEYVTIEKQQQGLFFSLRTGLAVDQSQGAQ